MAFQLVLLAQGSFLLKKLNVANQKVASSRRFNCGPFCPKVTVHIYVVVGISNSVLSILTANFPVRIEKKKFL